MSEGTSAVEEAMATPGIPVQDEGLQQDSLHHVKRTRSSSRSGEEQDLAGTHPEMDKESLPPVSEPPLPGPPGPPPPPSWLLPWEYRPVHPEVRYYNYEGFMNRMNDDGGDFAVEVLVIKSDWQMDMAIERGKRDHHLTPPPPPPPMPRPDQPQSALPQHHLVAPPPPPPPFPSSRGARPVTRKRKIPVVREMDNSQKHILQSQLQLPEGSKVPPDGRIMRVRVNSEAVVNALASVPGFHFLRGEDVCEFERPFRIIEQSYAGIKSRLAEMENWNPSSGSPDERENASSIDDGRPNRTSPAGEGPLKQYEASIDEVLPANSDADSTWSHSNGPDPADLDQIRCYVQFVESMILPIRDHFLSFGENKNPRVCFQDLPYLFKSGDLAFLPHQRKSGKPLHRSAAQQLWRMVSCRPATVHTPYQLEDVGLEDPYDWTIWSMYRLDYDGDNIVPIWHIVKFERFDGERDVTSLECYPLDFHPNKKLIIDSHKDIGHVFKSCISAKLKHHYYSGWTFITGVHAEPLDDESGNQVQYPEYIESDVVIDFKETLRSYPLWETDVGDVYPLSSDVYWEVSSELAVRIWGKDLELATGCRRYRVEEIPLLTEELIFYRYDAEMWMAQDEFLLKKGDFLLKIWSDEDLALLPKRLFAYILRERKFSRIDVEGIEINTGESNVSLDQIQMKPERRRMIRSAVSAHSKDKKGPSTFDLDLIRGKGRGLVILLHGAPGVGKTATAEAVAAETRRPLFPITCGDLGFSPSAVDKSLRDIFRHAHLWNCILLLDEADVFLTQRDRGGGNLERNALVGVFLKVLEYYSGILFLTTNRVGALDEAFQSRVHLSLSYPNLSLDDTVKILEANLSRLPRYTEANTARDGHIKIKDEEIIDFVRNEYKRYAERTGKDRGPWNGRQIRNAVQIAAGLALYDKQTELEKKGDDGIPAILTTEHFRAVAETTSEFEQYLEVTNVGDTETRAKRRQDRADHFRMKREQDDGHSDVEKRNKPQKARYRGSSHEKEHPRSGEHVPGPRSSGGSRRTRQPPSHHSSMSGRDYIATSTSFNSETGRGQQRPRGSQIPRRSREDYYEDEHYDEAEDSQGYYQEEALDDEEYDRGHRPRDMARRGKPESSQVGRGKY